MSPMSTNFSRNYIWALSMWLFLAASCYGQITQIADVVAGNFSLFGDIQFNDEGDRFYIVHGARDSIYLKDYWIQLNPIPESYLFGLSDQVKANFVQDVPGSKMLSLKSSILLFTDFNSDTLFVSDTFFVKEGPSNSRNLAVLEYEFEGNFIHGKHFPSPYGCRPRTVDAYVHDGEIYLTGTYDFDTMQLDDQKIGPINKREIFVAALDQALTCKWLTRMGYDDTELPTSIDVNSNHDVLTSGGYSSGIFIACEDTLFNPFGFATADAFVSIMDSTGDCKWIEGIHGTASQIVWSAKYLSDASVVVAGHHSGNADFGDTVLTGPAQTLNGFLAKYDSGGNLKFALQLEGNVTQNITDMVVTPDNNIWVCGSYFSDPMIIGDFELYLRGGSLSDAYIAKFDQNGNPVYARSFGGKDLDICLKLETGPGNSVYAIMNTKSDTVDVGDEVLALNTDFTNNIIIRIDDTTTSVKIPRPSRPHIRVFPNPVSGRGEIFIDFEQSASANIRVITLYNLSGQIIQSYRPGDGLPLSIQVPDIAAGIYILSFDFGSYRISEKIVVVR